MTLTRESLQNVRWPVWLILMALQTYLISVVALCCCVFAMEATATPVFILAMLLMLGSGFLVSTVPAVVLLCYCGYTLTMPGFVMPCARKSVEDEELLDNVE